MPSADDLTNFNRLRNSQAQPAMPPPPPLPDDVKQRFPSMAEWEREFEFWATQLLGNRVQGPV